VLPAAERTSIQQVGRLLCWCTLSSMGLVRAKVKTPRLCEQRAVHCRGDYWTRRWNLAKQ